MSHESQQPSLGVNRVDGLTSLAKGVLGTAPFLGPTLAEILGPTLAEIVGHVIPNQRFARIAEFVRRLDERMQRLEKEAVQDRMQEPDNIDLIEDAFTQVARATTQERIEHIASVVVNGIAAEELNHAESKRMLWLLGQLNDEDIVLLRSSLPMTREDYESDAEFQKQHSDLLAPDAIHRGSSDDEFEAAALKASYRQHLLDLSLIRQRFKNPKRGEFPEFDQKTGMIKAHGSEVTRWGKMFLRYLELIPDWYQH